VSHHEAHRVHRVGWLRAAVLGANDGIISTASIIIGVAAAGSTHEDILLVGVAGLVAGAMSMAAGEYVSVSSQSDTEKADLAQEQKSLEEDFDFEKQELAEIYQDRGLDSELAMQVADQLMAHDALGAHVRDELGLSQHAMAQPVQAAFSSASTFTIGAALPLLTAWFLPTSKLIPSVAVLSLIFLAVLGGIAAQVGGAPIFKGAFRVMAWGTLAMAITAIVGRLFGVGG
jgi:vacuolar iron transporter family protein